MTLEVINNKSPMIKKIVCVIIFFVAFQLQAQKSKKPYSLNKVSPNELLMKFYEKDSTANALVLFEYGDMKIENIEKSAYFETKIYKKIKVLKDKGKDQGIVKIKIYNEKNKIGETVIKIKGITHNSNEESSILKKENIYTNTINENWKEVTLVFPNVKVGSVIEYEYVFKSNIFLNFKGWVFQSDIPKVYSEFHSVIPEFWVYKRFLVGNIELSKNKSKIKKKCFHINSSRKTSCIEATYAMKYIPAFIEEEYALAPDNYIANIKFVLTEGYDFYGTSYDFASSWLSADMNLMNDENIGLRIKYFLLYKRFLPKDIVVIEDKLEKSKAIYNFIQNYFTLEQREKTIYENDDMDTVFKNKMGSQSEINLALINALRSAGIDAKIVLLTTRDTGIPILIHPFLSDFNYLAAFVKIENESYILDPSDQYAPFNMLPFQALNLYGRVLDFEKVSYWFDIKPKKISNTKKFLQLSLNENGILNGKLKESTNGYYSRFKREIIDNSIHEDYLEYLESKYSNLEIISYKINNLKEFNNYLQEEMEVEIEIPESLGNTIYLNPFIDKYTSNPFQLNERSYPVDFGFKVNDMYMTSIEIPNSYFIKAIPKNIAFKLPNDGGSFIADFKKQGNKITVISRIQLNKTRYNADEYPFLKEFFNQIIKIQNNFIILEKTNIE